jgi:hypothetical protein
MGDIIKMYLKEAGYEDVNWIYVGQDRNQWQSVVNTVMKLRVP